MRFLANCFNHSFLGQRSLEDPVAIFGHQLKALGHQFVWDRSNQEFNTERDGYNIIVEGFSDRMVPIFAAAHMRGARFVCLATEEPTTIGFNHGVQYEMWKRQKAFPRAMMFFDAILHLVPGEEVTKWYSQFQPSCYVELGYAPTLVREETCPDPPFDYGFYGSLTDRRARILDRLEEKTGSPVYVIDNFPDQVTRDREMQKVRVILQLRKFDEMGIVSSSRCNTALCLGRPIAAEPHAQSYPWDEIIEFTSTEDEFLDRAIEAAASWKSLHAKQFEAFKRLLPPDKCVGDALNLLAKTRQRAAA